MRCSDFLAACGFEVDSSGGEVHSYFGLPSSTLSICRFGDGSWSYGYGLIGDGFRTSSVPPGHGLAFVLSSFLSASDRMAVLSRTSGHADDAVVYDEMRDKLSSMIDDIDLMFLSDAEKDETEVI